MKKIIIKENEHKILPLLWTGKETEMEYLITLAGRGASIDMFGLFLGNGNHGLKCKITVVHKAEDTKSNIIIKGALRDMASVFFDGLIKIEQGAKGTNAWLAAHLLLLSPKARGITIPNLEILENDVKAGHATTVGRLSDLELFYLMSRGLSAKMAKELIVEGFFEDLITKFPESLQKKARKVIAIR